MSPGGIQRREMTQSAWLSEMTPARAAGSHPSGFSEDEVESTRQMLEEEERKKKQEDKQTRDRELEKRKNDMATSFTGHDYVRRVDRFSTPVMQQKGSGRIGLEENLGGLANRGEDIEGYEKPVQRDFEKARGRGLEIAKWEE